MSVYATVACDAEVGPGDRCMAEGTTAALASTAAQVRAYLRGQGWHRTTTGQDICPDCWKAGRR